MESLSIIIPCYNEERTIAETVRRVLAADLSVRKQVVVVDDGSKDRTREILKILDGITVLLLSENQGKGAALRAGFAVATGDYVVVQDADAEYDPKDLRGLIEKAREGHAVVYGSRRLGKARNPSAGRFFYAGGVFLSWLANLLYGTKLTDEATCYKMFRRTLLQKIPLRCTRFEFCPEVTAKVARSGEHIVEVPISYAPRSRAEGKKIHLKDGIDAIWTLMRYRFWRPATNVTGRLLVLTQAVDIDDANLGFFHGWIVAAAARATTVTVLAQRVGRFALPHNVTVRSMGPGTKTGRYARLWWSCLREIPKQDAVFCHMAPEYALIAGSIARLRFRRIGLWYVHKSITRRLRWALRFVNVVFTASPESFRIPSPKVRMMGHGIPTDLFFPAAQPLSASPFRLLFVGRMTPVKGVEVVLRALAVLHGRGVADTRLTVVGDAYLFADRQYREKIRTLAASLGIAASVDWRGKMPYADLPSLYRAHHALVHASETGSVDKVVLEALASGLMVFSSSEAFAALLPERFHFEKGNVASLADALATARALGPDSTLCKQVREGQDARNLWGRMLEDLFLQDGSAGKTIAAATIPASAVVLTYNSAATLQKTVDSVRAFQEILIVDGGSTDATRAIAHATGCRIIPQQQGVSGPIKDFAAVRMRAMMAATYDWVYMIDSDEEATPRLLRAMEHATRAAPAAYWVDRRYLYEGGTVQHAATYPNRQLRFFHRACVTGYERRMHERPLLQDGVTPRLLDGWICVPLPSVFVVRKKWIGQAHFLADAHPPTSFFDGVRYGTRECILGMRHVGYAAALSVFRAPARLPFVYEWARLPYYWTAAGDLWRAAFLGRRTVTDEKKTASL